MSAPTIYQRPRFNHECASFDGRTGFPTVGADLQHALNAYDSVDGALLGHINLGDFRRMCSLINIRVDDFAFVSACVVKELRAAGELNEQLAVAAAVDPTAGAPAERRRFYRKASYRAIMKGKYKVSAKTGGLRRSHSPRNLDSAALLLDDDEDAFFQDDDESGTNNDAESRHSSSRQQQRLEQQRHEHQQALQMQQSFRTTGTGGGATTTDGSDSFDEDEFSNYLPADPRLYSREVVALARVSRRVVLDKVRQRCQEYYNAPWLLQQLTLPRIDVVFILFPCSSRSVLRQLVALRDADKRAQADLAAAEQSVNEALSSGRELAGFGGAGLKEDFSCPEIWALPIFERIVARAREAAEKGGGEDDEDEEENARFGGGGGGGAAARGMRDPDIDDVAKEEAEQAAACARYQQQQQRQQIVGTGSRRESIVSSATATTTTTTTRAAGAAAGGGARSQKAVQFFPPDPDSPARTATAGGGSSRRGGDRSAAGAGAASGGVAGGAGGGSIAAAPSVSTLMNPSSSGLGSTIMRGSINLGRLGGAASAALQLQQSQSASGSGVGRFQRRDDDGEPRVTLRDVKRELPGLATDRTFRSAFVLTSEEYRARRQHDISQLRLKSVWDLLAHAKVPGDAVAVLNTELSQLLTVRSLTFQWGSLRSKIAALVPEAVSCRIASVVNVLKRHGPMSVAKLTWPADLQAPPPPYTVTLDGATDAHGQPREPLDPRSVALNAREFCLCFDVLKMSQAAGASFNNDERKAAGGAASAADELQLQQHQQQSSTSAFSGKKKKSILIQLKNSNKDKHKRKNKKQQQQQQQKNLKNTTSKLRFLGLDDDFLQSLLQEQDNRQGCSSDDDDEEEEEEEEEDDVQQEEEADGNSDDEKDAADGGGGGSKQKQDENVTALMESWVARGVPTELILTLDVIMGVDPLTLEMLGTGDALDVLILDFIDRHHDSSGEDEDDEDDNRNNSNNTKDKTTRQKPQEKKQQQPVAEQDEFEGDWGQTKTKRERLHETMDFIEARHEQLDQIMVLRQLELQKRAEEEERRIEEMLASAAAASAAAMKAAEDATSRAAAAAADFGSSEAAAAGGGTAAASATPKLLLTTAAASVNWASRARSAVADQHHQQQRHNLLHEFSAEREERKLKEEMRVRLLEAGIVVDDENDYGEIDEERRRHQQHRQQELLLHLQNEADDKFVATSVDEAGHALQRTRHAKLARHKYDPYFQFRERYAAMLAEIEQPRAAAMDEERAARQALSAEADEFFSDAARHFEDSRPRPATPLEQEEHQQGAAQTVNQQQQQQQQQRGKVPSAIVGAPSAAAASSSSFSSSSILKPTPPPPAQHEPADGAADASKKDKKKGAAGLRAVRHALTLSSAQRQRQKERAQQQAALLGGSASRAVSAASSSGLLEKTRRQQEEEEEAELQRKREDSALLQLVSLARSPRAPSMRESMMFKIQQEQQRQQHLRQHQQQQEQDNTTAADHADDNHHAAAAAAAAGGIVTKLVKLDPTVSALLPKRARVQLERKLNAAKMRDNLQGQEEPNEMQDLVLGNFLAKSRTAKIARTLENWKVMEDE